MSPIIIKIFVNLYIRCYGFEVRFTQFCCEIIYVITDEKNRLEK